MKLDPAITPIIWMLCNELLKKFTGVGRKVQLLNFIAMDTKLSKVDVLRKLVYGTMHQVKFLMDKSIVHGSLKKYMAIEELTQRFDAIVNKDLDTHYFWLVTLRNQVIDILPPAAGKYGEQRTKLIQLLNEAENKVNTNAKTRVAIH